MNNLILIAAAALVAGLLIGLLLGRSTGGSTLRQRRAEQQIDELRSEYTRYQAQVNEHFMESAHLLRRFNDTYRDVNQHMARGANRLCNDREWLEEIESSDRSRLENNREAKLGSEHDSGVEPPRDYAPKSDPEAKGTLEEGFDLSEEELARRKARESQNNA